jgi:hypothetical protein
MTFLNDRQNNQNVFNTLAVQGKVSTQLTNADKMKAKNLKPMCNIKRHLKGMTFMCKFWWTLQQMLKR